MAIKSFTQEFWSEGLSDSLFIGGGSGLIVEAIGVDIHNEPGTVKLSKKLTKETGCPTELCHCAVSSSDISTYWFSYSSGKIWQRTYLGAWSLVHTTPTCSYFNGAAEFVDSAGQARIYYSYRNSATGYDVLSYKPIPGLANWTDAVENWKTNAQNFYNALWHPMVVQSIFLAIGNGRRLATVSDTNVFTASGTADVTLNYLPLNWEITSMIDFADDVLIGASKKTLVATADYSGGLLLRWDFSASTWTSIKPVPSEGVNAMVKTDLGTFIFSGNKGIIYSFDGTNLDNIKFIPKSPLLYDASNAGYDIYPNSVCNFQNFVLFGLSQANLYTEAYNEGVYTLGRRSSQYPLALTMQYTAPEYSLGGGSYGISLSNLKFGAIISTGASFLVSYYDATVTYGTTGVAVMETAKRTANGWISLNVTGNKERAKTFLRYVLAYKKMTSAINPVDLSIADYWKNYTGVQSNFLTYHWLPNYNTLLYEEKAEASSIMFRIYFAGDPTTDETSILTSFYCEWNERDKL